MVFDKGNPIVGLSPMDGVTDCAFRQTQCYVHKPDLIFTEFVSAEGISRGGVKLYDQLLFLPNERPIIGQLFGKDPESFYKGAVILSHLGFDGIDINMGCPAKTVTQHGSGAALIGKPELAAELIKSTQQGINDYVSGKVKITDIGLKTASLEVIKRNLKFSNITTRNKPTFSIKTRLGVSENTTETWIPFLLQFKPDFLTLHGRTLKQGYAGTADWSAIALAANMSHDSGVPLLGNGDVQNHQQALEHCQKFNVDGVLIGRASMGNPWVFTDQIPSFRDRFSIMCYHAQKFQEIFPHRQFDPLRRHFLLYTSGHPRAKQLRNQIVHLTSIEQLYALEADFLTC